MPFIDRDNGGVLHYNDRGIGPALVLVHGWGMSGRVWRFQEEGFCSSYRVITIDLRGHGLSTLNQLDGLTMTDLAVDLVTLFRRLEVSHATIIGWSLGAQIVLEAFKSVKEKVAAIVLVGGTPRFSSGDGFESGLQPQEVRGMALRLKRDKARTMGDFFRGMFLEGEMTKAQNQRVVKEIIIPSVQPETATLLMALEALAESDQRNVLPDIDVPTLLIHGAGDSTCLPEASTYMAQRIRNSELVMMAGCGHAPFISRPDDFNGLLDSFLARVYGGH